MTVSTIFRVGRERILRLGLVLGREVRATYERQAGCVDRYGECDRVIGVLGTHRSGRQHDHLVRVDGYRRVYLGAADHDSVAAALDDPQVRVRVRLLRGTEAAVALDVCLGDADR